MSEMKTKRTDASVEEYLASIPDERKREDSRAIVAMMREVTGEEPAMWGDSIVGFGTYHYRYATGREGDWPLTGLAARKQAITVYVTSGFDRYQELLAL